MEGLSLGTLSGRKILLAVTGSIAAYKIPLLLRSLQNAGAHVRVILTESATRFIGSPVFKGLGAEVFDNMWQGPGELHVELADWAELIVVAPATADCLSRLAHGRATDLLSATLLCASTPLAVAPAMHPRMWAHPAVKENVRILAKRGVLFCGPVDGEVASGDTGMGRMEEPEQLALAIQQLLTPKKGKLVGRHVVVTAGPTSEAIDPVRAITNASSGKMGYALAATALAEGAKTTLISGPVRLPTPPGVRMIRIESALDMQKAMAEVLGQDLEGADVLIMAAAVSDYRVFEPSKEKLKRSNTDLSLKLTPNPDLLGEVGLMRKGLRPVLVGFALETKKDDELMVLGREKLIRKRVDLVVANSVSDSLGREDNVVRLVSARDCTPLEKMSKFDVAAEVLDWISRRLGEPLDSEITH